MKIDVLKRSTASDMFNTEIDCMDNGELSKKGIKMGIICDH